jgi:hypothetical protein
MVATPVSRVECRIGAGAGLWFVGISRTRPACLASAYFSGSVPPTNQKTDGFCHAARTLRSPRSRRSAWLRGFGCRLNASGRWVASGSLMTIALEPSRRVGGVPSDGVGVGRRPHACSLTELRISVRPTGAHNHADAALSMACRPVRNVGSSTGAKRGE